MHTHIICFFVILLLSCSPSVRTLIFQGFNDLGYSGCSDTSTPNIDKLAIEESLRIRYNYVERACSPTRSALMSGRYPSTLGLQNLMFSIEYPVALTRQVSILSEEFQANGYSTHCIGYVHESSLKVSERVSCSDFKTLQVFVSCVLVVMSLDTKK